MQAIGKEEKRPGLELFYPPYAPWRGAAQAHFFYVADMRGRIVEARPVQKFSGLEKLIKTGQQEREYGK